MDTKAKQGAAVMAAGSGHRQRIGCGVAVTAICYVGSPGAKAWARV